MKIKIEEISLDEIEGIKPTRNPLKYFSFVGWFKRPTTEESIRCDLKEEVYFEEIHKRITNSLVFTMFKTNRPNIYYCINEGHNFKEKGFIEYKGTSYKTNICKACASQAHGSAWRYYL